MAVTATAPVRTRYFVRLKLRLLRNGLRGPGTRVFGFVLGLVFGFWMAAAGFLWFLLAGLEPRADIGLVTVVFTGSAIVLGWVLLPLLFFGVDETLDPARFALLPLPRRTLARGMLAAAAVGIPGVATAVALAGAVVAAGTRGGVPGAAVGLAGALWWWSHTLESAMLGASSGGRPGRGPARGGAVDALVPRPLRNARADTFLGILARELRYWSRDPRRRAGLISAVVAGIIVPIALRVAGGTHGARLPLPFAVAFPALIGAVLVANQFGYDGTAYSMHLLTAVRGRTELRARATALAVILLPFLVVVAVVVAVLTHDPAGIAPALGTIAGVFGTVLGVESVLSIFVAYPMPESRNVFSVNTGTGGAKAFVAMAGVLMAAALAAPVLVVAGLLHGLLAPLVIPLGIGYGLAALLVGTYIGGDALERRGPELLVSVTPRR